MLQKNSHCSYCGTRFSEQSRWPRQCRSCRITNYANPLPVAVTLVPLANGLVVIRRNIEPQKGTLTLPGGYIDLGETWQDAASRELFEETGISVASENIHLYHVQNGLDDTLVIFGLANHQPFEAFRPFSSAETQEVMVIEEPIPLGFPMHTDIVERYFRERSADHADG